jgi:hypothetical protein
MSAANGKVPDCVELVKDQLPSWIMNKIREGEMVTHGVRVDPELATAWLESNTHNRPHKPRLIAELSEAIKAGKWKQTHQGIAFDPKGTLLDGQNRLWSIIESARAVPISVTFNEPMECQKYIDVGHGRTPTDLLRLAGYEWVGALQAAIIKALAKDGQRRSRLRTDELVSLADSYGDGIRFILEATRGRRIKGVTQAPLLAVCVRAHYKRGVSRERLRQFVEILINGQQNGAGDIAVILLRNRLLTCTDTRNRVTREIIHGLTERALQAFIGSEEIKSLRGADKELFPLPHEK